jgi:hypothetical protein
MSKKSRGEIIEELQYNPEVVILSNPLSAPKLVKNMGRGKKLQLNEVYTPKLFYDIISRITPEHLRQFDEGKTTVSLTLNIRDFLKSVNAGSSKSLYGYVISCIDQLQTTQVKWSDAEKDYGTTIITHYEHHRGTGKIDIVLYKDFVKRIVDVTQTEHFSFLKTHLYRLQNAQAIKLFPYFVSWRNRGRVEVSIELFKRKFGYDTEGYRFFNNLKNKVIDPAIKEINEKTDLRVVYKLLGENLDGSRPRVTGLQFFISEAPKQETLAAPNAVVLSLISESDTRASDKIQTLEAWTNQPQAVQDILKKWGVAPAVFAKIAHRKTATEIQAAIAYTADIILLGKAAKPAALFIDALKKGYQANTSVVPVQNLMATAPKNPSKEIDITDLKKQGHKDHHQETLRIFYELLAQDTAFLPDLLTAIRDSSVIGHSYDFSKDLSENMQSGFLKGAILNIAIKVRAAAF